MAAPKVVERAQPLPRVFVAVDTPSLEDALALADKLAGTGVALKFGLEFFSAQGAPGVRAVSERAGQAPVFLDLKFHDIPNTVAGAIRAVAPLGTAVINVHAAGGPAMMRTAAAAAREAATALGLPPPVVLGVTVLTSLDDNDLRAVGQQTPAVDQVVTLAKAAQASGLDGVVCSAMELKAIVAACGTDFVTMVPGIRPSDAASADQKRVVTPEEAIANGAHCLVVGRPITMSPDPAAAASAILAVTKTVKPTAPCDVRR